MRTALHVSTLLVALALLGCAGPGTVPVDTGSAGVAITSAAGSTPGAEMSAGNPELADGPSADWRRWVTDPGTPGVDYDPQRIAVFYSADAQIPASMGTLAPPAGQRGDDRPNSILRQNARFTRLTDYLAARYGLAIEQQVYWRRANYATFTLPAGADAPALLAQLNANYPGLIERAYYDRLASCDWTPTDPDYFDTNSYGGVLWGLKIINCADAWDYTRGDPTIRIAVVDSGVRITHEELNTTVLKPADLADEIPDGYFLDLVNNDNTVEDLDGHGTMCAGAIAAAANGITIIGVAPSCRVLPVKINNGGSFPWTIGYAGIVLAHMLNADVISCSWGHNGGFDPQELTIINQVTDEGSLVVGAAGNDDAVGTHYPSDFAVAVSVGASDPWDVRSSFSNYGTGVDIAAPGQWMKRALADGDSSYSNDGGGTSYACPLVAGAAGLIKSVFPDLLPADIKDLLETTGDEVSGFEDGVLRLNVGAALDELNKVHVSIPYQPAQLAYTGTIALAPDVRGEVDRVDALLNGEIVDSKTAPPWDFSIDTGGLGFGIARIEFIGYQGTDSSSASLSLLVDNTDGEFPVVEGFEDATPAFLGLDLKNYDPALLDAIHTYGEMGTYWTPADLATAGPGAWGIDNNAAYEGFRGMFCGLEGNTYGNWEMDALVSRQIDLRTAADPTLVFHQHYNIQRGNQILDRGWVYVTTDGGQTFTPATLREGGDALFSGYQPDWETAQIDLSPFSGQLVRLVLAFESGRRNAGQQAGEPAGWWVDDFTVATDYQEHPPTIGDISVPSHALYGSVPDAGEISVAVSDPLNVTSVRFVLDCAPLGETNPADVEVVDDVQPFETLLAVPDVPNQLANLDVYYYDSEGTSGPVRRIPVFIFNKLGDTNGDGVVDAADVAGYPAQIGLGSSDEGYIPFFDSDLDGLVTEADAGVVGYHFDAGAS